MFHRKNVVMIFYVHYILFFVNESSDRLMVTIIHVGSVYSPVQFAFHERNDFYHFHKLFI